FSRAEKSRVGPGPKIAIVVVQQLRDAVVRQTLLRCNARERAVLKSQQTAAQGSDPHTFCIRQQRRYARVRPFRRWMIAFGRVIDYLPEVAGFRSEPDSSMRSLRQRPDADV